MSGRARTTTTDIPVDRVRPADDNPRTHLESIDELAASIKEIGQLVPIVVEQRPDGAYDLLAGHRRCAALTLLGHATVRAEIRTGKRLDDLQRFELMLAENAQRRSLDPIDEANAYRRLIRDRGLTHLEVAHLVGVSDFTVSRRLELLRLNKFDQERVRTGKLTLGGARHLLNLGRSKGAPRGKYSNPREDDTVDGAHTIVVAVTDKEWAEITRRCKARNFTPEAFARAAIQNALRA